MKAQKAKVTPAVLQMHLMDGIERETSALALFGHAEFIGMKIKRKGNAAMDIILESGATFQLSLKLK